MILPSDLKELEFEILEKIGDSECWSKELPAGIIIVQFSNYQKESALLLSECGYGSEMLLECEPTEERIKNLIKALS